jgi:signal transduction histidine kinase
MTRPGMTGPGMAGPGVMGPLATLPIAREADIVAVRQQVRQVAETLGLDPQDQIRLATAVSEIARNAHAYAGGGRAEIRLDQHEQRSWLLVRISDDGPGIADLDAVLAGQYHSATGMGLGLVGARRLTDRFAVTSTPDRGTIVELAKALPAGRPLPSAAALAKLARTLAQSRDDDPATALREQNRELLRSLGALRERQEELERLGSELEDTTRGVVALYAELDEKAAELRQVSELKSRFISNMSHEFRTPLNSVLALSRLLLDRADGELTPEQEKQVQFIRQSAAGLLELVNDLLDLAKIEAGKVEVRAAAFDLADLFAGLRGMLKPLPAARGVELIFDEPVGLPRLFTDETKLNQILRNLVSNALKFTEQGQVVVAAAASGAGEVAFTVSDTGIGIAQEDQQRIFQEFEQVESGLQARSKGTGLGLPLSRRLAELLGGTLTVESTPGKGSVFHLRIPLHHPAALPPPDAAAGRRALVVDDEEATRYVLRRLITADPAWEVTEAMDGLAGLQRARELRPDVIVLDLNMPGLDGFGALRELAADPATRDLPVVVCTALPPDAALRARLPPGTTLLPKSALDRASLQAALRCVGIGLAGGATEHA